MEPRNLFFVIKKFDLIWKHFNLLACLQPHVFIFYVNVNIAKKSPNIFLARPMGFIFVEDASMFWNKIFVKF